MARADWHHLYDTSRWKKRRELQLCEEPLCRLCMQAHRITPATVADHVVAHKGDAESFFYGELQSLCKSCHDSVKQAQEHNGYAKGSHVDGMPIDPSHHWN